MTVANAGPADVPDAILHGVLAAGVTIDSVIVTPSTAAVEYLPGEFFIQFIPLAAGSSFTIVVQEHASQLGANTDSFNVTAVDAVDLNPANNTASVTQTVANFGFTFGMGPELQANTYTTSNQMRASVALDAAGDYVVAWQSLGQDGSGWGIYAQRYNAAGVARGSEFRVNTYTTGDQRNPRVAMDAAGDFVVAWQDQLQDGSYGVFAQRYDASGTAQLGEFRVNAPNPGDQRNPAVAMDALGDFVVGWVDQQYLGYGSFTSDIMALRYNATGVAQGSALPVNTNTTGGGGAPSAAMDAAGDFVLAWESTGDGSGYGVYSRRYNAAGVAQGGKFLVNTFTAGNQVNPSVAADALGDFVVAWQSDPRDGGGSAIYAQRYNAAGVAAGAEFRVNQLASQPQSHPSAAMDAAGDFVVAWQSYLQDGSHYGVYAQRYNAAGVIQISEFLVNTYTTNDQSFSSVAMDSGGDFVVAWQSFGQDGDLYGVYAQRYVNYSADLQVTIGSVSPNPATPNQPYAYTVTVTNAGPQTATNVVVMETTGAGSQLFSVTPSTGGNITQVSPTHDNITYASLAAGASATIVVQATASQVGTYSNTASVTATQLDPNLANSTASVGETVSNPVSSVTSRFIFYAGSSHYDTVGGQRGPLAFSDDNAIATDKTAYLPGLGASTFNNVSSYDQGITGIMVDLKGGGTHSGITLANITNDFTFRTGNNNSPASWATNTILPTAVTVRLGMTGAAQGTGTVSGSDRVELMWANNAIQQKWVEVIVKATADTGLSFNDVFFFGNEIGNTGNHNSATVATTGVGDVSDTVNHGANSKNNIAITNIYDFNRDGLVATGDISDTVNHGTNSKNGLVFINVGSGGPFAPEVAPASSDAGIASVLVSSSSSQLPSLPSIPAWLASRLGSLDLNKGTIAKYLTHLEHEATAKAKAILSEAKQVADALHLDDELLDSLLVRLA